MSFLMKRTCLKTKLGSNRLLLFVDCCVWSRIGQMARRSTPERSRARVYYDSSQRCRMRRRRRQDRRKSRELRNIQEWYGAWVGWFLERHTESLKHPEPMHVHWMKCAKCDAQREKCAHACARWGVICNTSRRVHDMCQCLNAKSVQKPRKLQSWWMCKTAKKFENSGQLGQQLKQCPSRYQFLDASVHMNHLCSSLTISPTTFGLAFLLVATLATVENFLVLRMPPCRLLWSWRRRGWSRCREVRLPVLAEPFQILLNGRIQWDTE